MESDEYYDSLDEDSNYGSFESSEHSITENQVKIESVTNNKTKTQQPPQNTEKIDQEDDDIIPFYDQSLNKTEVELKKLFSKNGCEGDRPKKRFHKNVVLRNMTGKFKSNSYLDMFYAKMGVEKLDLTSRATCTDLSPKSYTTCADFEIASSVNLSEMESVCSSSKDGKTQDLSLSLTSLDSKLCSVSQQNLKITKDKNAPKKRSNKLNALNAPELGRLGPEIPKDKLELLKKRQEYGLKVSQKNKIRMIEKKLLQNLQQEIKECKKIK